MKSVLFIFALLIFFSTICCANSPTDIEGLIRNKAQEQNITIVSLSQLTNSEGNKVYQLVALAKKGENISAFLRALNSTDAFENFRLIESNLVATGEKFEFEIIPKMQAQPIAPEAEQRTTKSSKTSEKKAVMAADIVLKDKEGDVEMMNPLQDIVELRLSSGDGRIVMEIITLGEAVTEETFEYEGSNRKMVTVEFAKVTGLAIDSDNNEATGDTADPFHDHVKGFEWVVTVFVCADSKSEGKVTQDCVGAWDWDVLGVRAQVEIMTRIGDLKIENLPAGQVKGRMITVVIPYSKIGVSAGNTVRLYPFEKVYPAEVETPFEPVLLELQ